MFKGATRSGFKNFDKMPVVDAQLTNESWSPGRRMEQDFQKKKNIPRKELHRGTSQPHTSKITADSRGRDGEQPLHTCSPLASQPNPDACSNRHASAPMMTVSDHRHGKDTTTMDMKLKQCSCPSLRTRPTGGTAQRPDHPQQPQRRDSRTNVSVTPMYKDLERATLTAAHHDRRCSWT